MDRREELLKVIDNNITLTPLIDEMVFLEAQITEVKKLPFIKVHPKDPMKQKTTPAAKQYKELLQQYTNIVRMLMKATDTDADNEESPLRKWMNQHVNSE